MMLSNTIYQLADYVNAATDLAENLMKDLKKGDKISQNTVLALNKFKSAAYAMEDTQDELIKATTKNN